MDLKLKGITWVGRNISQKFETMCQEVDNIVRQDTVRYVENQMQTMGDSMKKFCSDVIQDFLPPSVDPVKREAQEQALEKNAAIGTYLKSIIGIQENPVDVFNTLSLVEPDAVDRETNQIGNELSGLHLGNQLSSPISVSEDPSVRSGSDLNSGHIDDVLANETSDVNNEENSLEEKSSTSWVLESTSCGEKDSSEASLICEFADGNQKNASCYVTEVSSVTSVCVVERQSAQKMGLVSDNFLSVSDSSNTSASEVAFSVVSSEEKVSETGLMSSANSQLMGSNRLDENSPENFAKESVLCKDPVDRVWSVSDCSDAPLSPTLSLIASLKDNEAKAGLLKSCSVLSPESYGEDVSRANCTLSLSETSENSDAELCGSAQFDACTFFPDRGYSHHCSDDFDYSGMETVELSEKAKLEESCVMVDSSALYAVSQRIQKLGSFKKRIKDAFASKKRLAKEYEQLAIWFGDSYIGPSQESSQALLPSTITSTLDSKGLNSNHISDSEWELL